MDEIQGKIEVKRKEIQVEKDAAKKAELQNDLQVLLIKRQVEFLRARIKQLKNKVEGV